MQLTGNYRYLILSTNKQLHEPVSKKYKHKNNAWHKNYTYKRHVVQVLNSATRNMNLPTKQIKKANLTELQK